MAEPARRLDDDQPKGVYDEPTGTAPSSADPRPNLRALEGGGETSPRKTDHLKSDDGETGAAVSLYNAESSAGESESSLYRKHVSDPKNKFSARRLLLNRRGAAGGGIVVFIVSAIIGFFLISGPAEAVQLSQVLQTPGNKNSSDSANRLGHLFRYSKTGKVSDTVMSRLGIGVFGSTAKQLSDIGIEIETDPLTKRPTRTTFDTQKMKSAFPELDGMSDTEAKTFIAEQLSQGKGPTISPDQVQGSNGEFRIDQSDFDLKSTKFFTKSTVSLLGDGRIVGGIKARSLTKFFELPSLFHPLSSLADDKLNSLTAAAKKKALAQQEQQNEDNITSGVEAEGETAVEGIKAGKAARSGIVGALTFTGGACIVYSTAGEIVKANHYLIELPAAIMALRIIAIGEQIKAGQDLTADQVDTLLSTLNQNGQSIWQGEALNALSKGGSTDSSLKDLPADYKQAFSSSTTAGSIQSAADDAISKVTGGKLHAGGTFGACGKVGTLAQIAVSLTIAVKEVFEEAASAGTLTPEVAAELAGLLAAKETLSQGETLALLHYINSFILSQTTSKLGANAFQGPVGGDLLAYGARAAANTAAIASGGVSLANEASTIVDNSPQPANSSSIAERLFNPDDYNSAFGKLIRQGSGSPMSDIAKIGSMFTNFGSMFSHSLAAVTPGALAANNSYDWGFPQYGMPDSLLNDPNLSDPYTNADYVAGLLNGPSGSIYQDRASKCFGVNISPQDDGSGQKGWDVSPQDEVDPAEASYADGKCDDPSEDWHRVEMFVFDTTTMKAVACYNGDDQSCTDLGAETTSSGSQTSSSSGGSSSGSTNPSGGSLPGGSAQDLAKQIIPYLTSGKIKCNSISNDIGCSDITNTANGVSIKGGQGCQVSALQPALLGMLLKLLQMNHTFTLSALCSDHHDDGLNGHAGGRAADFNIIDGIFMGPSATETWTPEKIQVGQKLDQDIASFMPTSTGFGQTQCHPTFSFLSGFSVFNDDCNHQHIQVEN